MEERLDNNLRSYGTKYFRRHIVELARRRLEIQVEDDVIRLTPQGLDYCETNIPGWQRDFK